MVRVLLIWPALLICAILPAFGTRALPVFHQAVEIETLVNRAAERLEESGPAVFAEFRRKGGPWRYGDVYLFVVDMRGVTLFNAAHPEHEGRDLLNERDADGKRFRQAFIETVSAFGSGWVDYMFPKPGQSVPTVKWSYVCQTHVAGAEALIGAGVYVE